MFWYKKAKNIKTGTRIPIGTEVYEVRATASNQEKTFVFLMDEGRREVVKLVLSHSARIKICK